MIIENFNREYLKYLFPQRTRLTTEYSLTESSEQSEIDEAITTMVQKDFDMIKNFLPARCSSILDVGCGLALINIFLSNMYDQPDVYLLDKTELDANKISGFNEKYKFYNSMNAAKEILLQNNVSSDRIHLYEAGEHSELYENKYDVICSLLSCGWHYSVNTYIDLFKETLSDDGVLVLDIRHDTDQVKFLGEDFVLVEQIYNYAESKHTGGNIGDRYIFRKK